MFALLLSAALISLPVTAEFHPGADGSLPELMATEEGDLILLEMEGFTGTVPGLPDIPSVPFWIPLEKGSRAASISVDEAVWETLETGLRIRPLPAPCILSGDPVMNTARSRVYLEDRFWPAEPAELTGSGFPGHEPSAELIVTPFRYNPVTGELQRLVSADFTVETETAPVRTPVPLTGGLRRMLIITDESIREPFDSLAAWRTSEGILTEVATTSEVMGFPGVDDPEKIRNYIIEYQADNGLDYVLLGGDVNYVPCRFAFPMSYGPYGGGRADNMPCDLYFSDLDGDWNADGDTTWGEVEDQVDLYADVQVGRAPCESLDEAWVFWNKIHSYETSINLEHHDTALLAGGVLWEEPFTDEKVVKTHIKETHFPGWFTFTERYFTEGNYSTSTMIAALDQGVGYVNMNDHGWISGVGCLNRGDVDQVNSGGRFFGMMYSIGCWTSAFDEDCVAEHFLNNPDGCGVSYIGNSSYGWGSPGNPLFGYSDRYDRELFKVLFQEPSLSLGEIVSLAKESFVPFAHQENCYRCVLYMVNLLGDPSLRPFRRTPGVPQIECPDFVSVNTSSFPVTVTSPAGYDPEKLWLCAMDQGGAYLVEELDSSGFTVLQFTSPPQGDVRVTVTGTDLARTSVTVPQATGPLPVLAEVNISTQEGDSSAVPGSQAEISISLENLGTEPLTGTIMTASLVQGPGTLVQNTSSFGAIQPGGTAEADQPLLLNVDQTAQTGQLLDLELAVAADQGNWQLSLPVLVHGPGLHIAACSVDDSQGGNGNGFAEPGESFSLMLQLANTGLLAATAVNAQVSSQEPWLTWEEDTAFLSAIPANGTGELLFQGSVDQAAPAAAFPELTVATTAQPEWTGQEDFTFTVGDFLLSDDFEDGPGYWTHSGTGDMWHLSLVNPHSGEWAWYCGDEETFTYETEMNCSLTSPDFIVAPEAQFSFWSSFDVDLYGADGLYVILEDLDASLSDTLDFIGAGGLLGTGSRGTDGNMQWLPRSYGLSSCEAGTRARIHLVFFSDDSGDNIQGFHIDDISIDGCLDTSGAGPGTPTCLLGPAIPNPAGASFRVAVSVQSGPWSLNVYDLAGRTVLRSEREYPFMGSCTLDMTGMPGGIYLISLTCDAGTETRKVVIAGGF